MLQHVLETADCLAPEHVTHTTKPFFWYRYCNECEECRANSVLRDRVLLRARAEFAALPC